MDLDSFQDPLFTRIVDYYHGLDRSVWLLDLTTDLGVPVFAACSARIDQQERQVLVGLGAHFDPNVAAVRAFSEMNQKLAAYYDFVANAAKPSLQSALHGEPWWTKTKNDLPRCLWADAEQQPRRATAYTHRPYQDVRDGVATCVNLARDHTLDVLVLDLTRPGYGLHVVKVIVPGLRPYWRRLAPGRLYDVPVQMGWLAEPKDELQLNRASLFP